jgi:hypothetical protein
MAQETWHDVRMAKTRKRRRLTDAYKFDGFRTQETVQGIFGDPQVRLITLVRRSKKRSAGRAARSTTAGTTAGSDEYEICPAADIASTCRWRSDGLTVGDVGR